MKKLLVAFSLLAFLGCGDSKNSNKTSKPRPESLSGKPSEDIVRLKYDQIALNCQLWTQRGPKINLNLPANASASLDLKANPQIPAAMKLEARIENHEISVDLQITKSEILDSLSYRDERGFEYSAENTPHAAVGVSIKTLTTHQPGVVTAGSHAGARDLYERAKSTLFSATLLASSEASVTAFAGQPVQDFLSCVIATDIKPEYQDQFRSNAF